MSTARVVIVVTVYARGWIIAKSESGRGYNEYTLAMRYRDWDEFWEYRRDNAWPAEWVIKVRADSQGGLDV